MTPFAEYKHVRAQHPYYPAKLALDIVKAKHADPVVELHNANSGMYGGLERDGFSVSVAVSYDEYPDMSMDYGTIDDTPSPDAIRVPKLNGSYYQPAQYGYYHPTDGVDDPENFAHKGMARHIAWLAWRQAIYEQYQQMANNAISSLIVTARAYKNGIELGRSSVGGVNVTEWDEDSPYIQEVASDVIEDAIEEAKKALASLREN